MTEIVDRLLAGYPHAATCPACRSYAEGILTKHALGIGLAAVLGRHSADHRVDPLTVASEHFADDHLSDPPW